MRSGDGMADRDQRDAAGPSPDQLRETLEELEQPGHGMGPRLAAFVGGIAALWSLFQLWIASPLPFALGFGIIVDVPARGVHLAFGLVLCFLLFPLSKRLGRAGGLPLYDVALAILGCGAALYLFLGYDGLVARQGILLTYDLSLFGSGFHLSRPRRCSAASVFSSCWRRRAVVSASRWSSSRVCSCSIRSSASRCRRSSRTRASRWSG